MAAPPCRPAAPSAPTAPPAAASRSASRASAPSPRSVPRPLARSRATERRPKAEAEAETSHGWVGQRCLSVRQGGDPDAPRAPSLSSARARVCAYVYVYAPPCVTAYHHMSPCVTLMEPAGASRSSCFITIRRDSPARVEMAAWHVRCGRLVHDDCYVTVTTTAVPIPDATRRSTSRSGPSGPRARCGRRDGCTSRAAKASRG